MSSVAWLAEGGEERGGNGVGVLQGVVYYTVALNTVCMHFLKKTRICIV